MFDEGLQVDIINNPDLLWLRDPPAPHELWRRGPRGDYPLLRVHRGHYSPAGSAGESKLGRELRLGLKALIRNTSVALMTEPGIIDWEHLHAPPTWSSREEMALVQASRDELERTDGQPMQAGVDAAAAVPSDSWPSWRLGQDASGRAFPRVDPAVIQALAWESLRCELLPEPMLHRRPVQKALESYIFEFGHAPPIPAFFWRAEDTKKYERSLWRVIETMRQWVAPGTESLPAARTIFDRQLETYLRLRQGYRHSWDERRAAFRIHTLRLLEACFTASDREEPEQAPVDQPSPPARPPSVTLNVREKYTMIAWVEHSVAGQHQAQFNLRQPLKSTGQAPTLHDSDRRAHERIKRHMSRGRHGPSVGVWRRLLDERVQDEAVDPIGRDV